MDYLVTMRKLNYYVNKSKEKRCVICKIKILFLRAKYRKIGLKTGFSIGYCALGYGVVIPHYGTIVVGNANKIGKYAVLHTGVTISNNKKIIGDALYMSTGSKITSIVKLGDNITVAANSVVTKSIEGGNCLLVGMPAFVKNQMNSWYERDGFADRVIQIENLKSKMGLA
jgi:serine O-acetyltransferase